MKRIGYMLTVFPVFSETFVGTEMRALEQRGYSIVPIAFVSQPDQGQLADQPLVNKTVTLATVTRRQAIRFLLRHPLRLSKATWFVYQQQGISRASLLLYGAKLAIVAAQHRVDHFHAHFALNSTATAIVGGLLSNTPVSFVGHGFDVYATPADLTLKLHYAQFAVAVCEDMKRYFTRLDSKKIVHLIECGIELQRYPFKPHMRSNNKLLFIGRLTEKKGLFDLLKALTLIPNEHRPVLDIVGDGELRQSLERSIATYELQNYVNLLGARSSEWLIEHASTYLALAAPFCAAKNGDRDTGPVVVKESMALGLPVICTRFMGCNEMLTDQTGRLVETNNPSKLAQAICEVAQLSTFDRLTMLLCARTRLEKLFSTEVTSAKLAHALERVYP